MILVQLNDRRDSFVWTLTKKFFSVQSMYNDLMRGVGVPNNCLDWKIKVPLKIKIFLWYLKQGVILIKDNLVKRKWNGCTKCCFCSEEENIQHLFFECHMARWDWNAVNISFGFQPPSSMANLFGSWLKIFPPKLKNQSLIGAAAICWALWLSRNDVVCQRLKANSFLQVFFRGTYWIKIWPILSKEEERDCLKNGCQKLEITIMEVFSKAGWNFRKRIKS